MTETRLGSSSRATRSSGAGVGLTYDLKGHNRPFRSLIFSGLCWLKGCLMISNDADFQHAQCSMTGSKNGQDGAKRSMLATSMTI